MRFIAIYIFFKEYVHDRALTFYASYELSTIDHIFDQIIHFKSPCHSYALFEVIRHLPDTLGALVCTLRKPSFTYLLPPILLRVP